MIIDEMRKYAKQLLESKTVHLVIGYGISPGGDIIPLFIKEPNRAEELVWNEYCVYNLARYLTDRDLMAFDDSRSLGIVTKGCDLKSINVLIDECQIKRERAKIIGVTCEGMKSEAGKLLGKCQVCDVSFPDEDLCDVVIGESRTSPESKPGDSFQDVKEMDSHTTAEKRAFWDKHFARCIRCYACRSVCPLCYCKECVMEQHDPQWVSPAPSVEENRAFHIIRAYHLAGRCVDCGECERVCPVEIPLRKINRKMAQVVKESYQFEAGVKGNKKSPITWFNQNDPEDFME